MTKKIFVIAGFVGLATIIGFSVSPANPENDKFNVEAMPLKEVSGWGYEILVDHKIFIRQDFIPAVTGQKSFSTKADAMNTADLIVHKLVTGKPPAITKEELALLKVTL